MDREVQVVVKTSKLCNLRCRYCYEFPSLGDPAAMSGGQVATLFGRLAEHFGQRDARDGMLTRLRFVWHGGEPLLQPVEFYRQAFADQRRIFGDRTPVSNVVQTNLTVLDDARLRLLADFDAVGVSLDVAGGLRVNVAGRDLQSTVVANLRRLLDAPVNVAGLSVLTARNVDRVDEVFAFFDSLGLNFRVLPLFDTSEPGQTAPFQLTLEQELAALVRLFELWLGSDTIRRPPSPLDRYVRVAARHLRGQPGPPYQDRRDWLPILLVDTDGSGYTFGEPYGDRDWSLGNVFDQPLADLLASEAFERSAAAAERRVARNCLSCPFFTACGGSLVAETDTRERDDDGHGTLICTARPVVGYLVERLPTAAPDLVERPTGAGVDQPDVA